MNRKLKTTGFTIAELLTVVAVLAILIGILMPALNMAKKMAKETKQKAQIHSIDIGLNVYKNDRGDYPPSHGDNGSGGADYTYCGAQTLTEALMGQDLLGFNPKSIFEESDTDIATGYPGGLNMSVSADKKNLESRKGPYLDRTNIGVFRVEDVFLPNFQKIIAKDRYVICDSFTNFKRTIGGEQYKVGTPVLYFRANVSKHDIDSSTNVVDRIYNISDNLRLIGQGKIEQNAVSVVKVHEGLMGNTMQEFYERIEDTFVASITRPVNPDTFLLISAGDDGFYGTADDICNFEPNFK